MKKPSEIVSLHFSLLFGMSVSTCVGLAAAILSLVGFSLLLQRIYELLKFGEILHHDGFADFLMKQNLMKDFFADWFGIYKLTNAFADFVVIIPVGLVFAFGSFSCFVGMNEERRELEPLPGIATGKRIFERIKLKDSRISYWAYLPLGYVALLPSLSLSMMMFNWIGTDEVLTSLPAFQFGVSSIVFGIIFVGSVAGERWVVTRIIDWVSRRHKKIL